MIGGTLVNKKRSGFVRTPPNLAVRIGKHLLALPEAAYSVLDPTAGEGDFFYACAHNTQARLFGVEVSAERAAISRQRWPRAEIVQAAIESVHVPTGSMSLILANPPYFFQDGKRAEYRIIADAGEALMPGGVMVAIVPARSAWDGTMINHWLKYYDHIRVWKFPDRHSDEDEGAFEDSTQICVIGVRRKEPQPVTEAEKKRLLGFQWREPKKVGQSGWKYGSPPPTLPDVPLADPYLVPPARTLPRLVVRNADEATLLYALDKSGAHLSASWQQATTWPEEGFAGQPAMPYTGEAHLAAEVMIGGLDGEIVSGPGTGTDAEPHLFTAFVGKEWVSMPVDDELKEKLHEQGCVRVEMRQLMDKPILGVLNLARGTTRYYQGEQVFEFLQPWIPTLSSRVIAKRKPLYRLDPADWELRVLSQFGTDKRLPKAAFAGLAIPQLHRVFAMGRSLDVKGRTAIQGQPGTGKTRLAGGTAKRQAYRWRHRNTMFAGSRQPAWVRELRRAWLKNPLTLDMLGLEPVYGRRITGDRGAQGRIALDPSVHQVVAYRERATGRMLAPEDAGPAALPVLVTTPLKVTKEYGNEIRAAFPQAQVMHLESHRDIPRWLHCCASSHAPVVFGIVSHSLTRAFGREWREVVQEKPQITRVPNLDPDLALLPLLDPVYEQRGSRKLVGYRFKASGELLVKEKRVVYFSCPDCGGIIEAIPGKTNQPDEKEEKGKKAKPKSQNGEEEGDGKVPVTSRTYFATKPRWCKCATSQRGKEREAQGKVALRSPLWQDDRTKATNRKYPQVSFAQWSAAMSALKRQAAREQEAASLPLLAEQVRRDEGLLDQLLALAFADEPARSQLCALTERVDTGVATLRQTVAEQRAALAPILVDAALASREWPQGLEPAVELACRDLQSLQSCMPAITVRKEEVSRLVASLTKSETALRERVRQAIRRDGSHLLLHRLIACTRQQMNWQPVFFRGVFEQAHSITATGGKKQSGGGLGATLDGSRTPLRGVRLTQAESGPISIEEPDRTVAGGYDPVKVPDGTIIGYQMGKGGRVLVPVYGIHSHRVVGYAHDGKLITKKTCFEFTRPPADSFSPYQYLYRFFRGCVALSVIDESHNGRGRSTDIAHSHHFAMLAAQMRQLTSGTHFGGDVRRVGVC